VLWQETLPDEAAWSASAPLAFTESQNGRGWKGPLWVTQSNLLPKQGHLQQAAQDRVQAGLEYLQRRRLHSLPGQPVPVLRTESQKSQKFLSLILHNALD